MLLAARAWLTSPNSAFVYKTQASENSEHLLPQKAPGMTSEAGSTPIQAGMERVLTPFGFASPGTRGPCHPHTHCLQVWG